MKALNEYFDRIVSKYAKADYYDEVTRAKQEYFKRVGRVAEAADGFENHMEAFLDWYVFDRALDKHAASPAVMYYREIENVPGVSEDEKKIFRDISENNHSLFEFVALKKDDVYVKDLFNNEVYLIEDSEINFGFNKGDVFETRLIKFRAHLVFGSSFVFHPANCKKFMVKEIKKIKNMGREHRLALLHKYAVLKLKTEQYPHVDARDIYSEVLSFEAR